jgi:hypothetical protein
MRVTLPFNLSKLYPEGTHAQRGLVWHTLTIPEGLHVDALSFDGDSLTIGGCLRGSEAHCPVCSERSRQIHRLYTRTLADLPWSGAPVRLRVRVRKFFCDEPACERRIFAERLDEVVRPFARGTDLQRGALQWIAFSLGGEAGARLTRELGLRVGPDTLLNRTSGNFSADARKKPSASSSADGSSLRSSWEDAGRSLPVSRLR